VLAAQFLDRDARIGLPEEPHDLRFGNRFFIVRPFPLGPDSEPKRYSSPGGRRRQDVATK
jgi:hypothetical protein